jgi:uncharacterized protein YndB with AHSA1/START domain
MIRTELTTLVNRPPQAVFDYLADFANLPAYDRWVLEVTRTSDGPVGLGTTWTHVRRQGPQRIVAPIRMVEFESPRRFVMESGSGGFEVRSTMTFDASGDGATTVRELLEMRTRGLTRLFEPMIARQVPKQGAEVHERMKQVIEGLSSA